MLGFIGIVSSSIPISISNIGIVSISSSVSINRYRIEVDFDIRYPTLLAETAPDVVRDREGPIIRQRRAETEQKEQTPWPNRKQGRQNRSGAVLVT